MNENTQNIKKLNWTKLYENIKVSLKKIFSNNVVQNIVVHKNDKNLINNFTQIIICLYFIESKLNFEHNISVKFAKILSHLANAKIKIINNKNLTYYLISNEVRYLNTYLLNMYNVNFISSEKNNVSLSLDSILEKAKLIQKNEILNKPKSNLNDNFDNSNKKTILNGKPNNNFNNLLQGLMNKNAKSKIFKLINDDFYPYLTKPKIIIYLKYAFLWISVFSFLIGGALFITGLINLSNQQHITTSILFLLSEALVFWKFVIIIKGVVKKNIIRNYYSYNVLYLILAIIIFLLLFFSSGQTFHFNFNFNDNIISNKIYFVLLLCAWSTSILYIITCIIMYAFSPKLDKNKLQKFQQSIWDNLNNDK